MAQSIEGSGQTIKKTETELTNLQMELSTKVNFNKIYYMVQGFLSIVKAESGKENSETAVFKAKDKSNI